MRITGFDVSSTSTGYATLSGSKLLKSGTGTIKTKSGDDLCDRLVQFREQVIKILSKVKPDAVVIEDVYVRHRSVIIILARFSGVILEAVAGLGYKPVLLEATKVRKALGIKNKKELVFAFVKEKFALDEYTFGKDNDVTDAIALTLAYKKLLSEVKEGGTDGKRGQ